MASELQFFDVLCKIPNVSWSPNTLKLRYVINYKGIQSTSAFLSYPDIEQHHKDLGLKPNKVPEEAYWPYTCPAIKDGDVLLQNTEANILPYLEKKYPEPSIYPYPDSQATSKKAEDAISTAVFQGLVWHITPLMPDFLDERGGAYYDANRSAMFKVPIRGMNRNPEETWTRINNSFGGLAKLWDDAPGPFLMGEQPIFADFCLASILGWVEKVDREAFDRILALSPHFKEIYQAIHLKYKGVSH